MFVNTARVDTADSSTLTYAGAGRCRGCTITFTTHNSRASHGMLTLESGYQIPLRALDLEGAAKTALQYTQAGF